MDVEDQYFLPANEINKVLGCSADPWRARGPNIAFPTPHNAYVPQMMQWEQE